MFYRNHVFINNKKEILLIINNNKKFLTNR